MPMTDAGEIARRLLGYWRNRANAVTESDDVSARVAAEVLRSCADELEAALLRDPAGCEDPSVMSVRKFKDGRELGVGFKGHSWFVYDKNPGQQWHQHWHQHCGPYSSSHQAADWIWAIREVNR